mmetsp:Transcript_18497/g.57434  ORF Transcript_18497/g.57434 Transcript_18497/m.57434 type:complete len:224 (+) Transcript_18497:378-1049(+)
MAEAMRHEDSAHARAQHFVQLADEQPRLLEAAQNVALTKVVQIFHRDAGLNGGNQRELRIQHRVVDRSLIGRKAPRHRDCRRDVGAVSAILAAKIHEHQLAIAHRTRVGRARVAVVQLRGAAPAGDDGRVRRQAHAAALVALKEETRLGLIFHHARRALLHHRHVRRRADAVDIRQHLDLGLALDHAALGERIKEQRLVDHKVAHPLERRRPRGQPRVAVDPT